MRISILTLFWGLCLFSLPKLQAQTTYTENFDVTSNWGGGAAGGYNAKTYFRAGSPATFASNPALRQTAGSQDGFPGTRGGSTYAWRLEDAANNWTATIATGGVGTFSVWVRRWDASPAPVYICEYSTNNGGSWTTVETINSTWLTNSDWKEISGTINTTNGASATDDIIIRIRRTGGERLMIDDFSMTTYVPAPVCTTPNRLAFVVQPSTVQQNTNMTAVTVKAYCSSNGGTATSYTGAITLKVSAPGCGYTSQTVNAVNGVATFPSVNFLRSPQSNLRMVATAASLDSAISNTFNITAPSGTPVTTTLRNDNFEVSPPVAWAYTVGTPTNVGSGGSSGSDVSGIKTFSSNRVLAKSYSINNGSGERGSQNTITFANVTGLGAYSQVNFFFKVASPGTGGSGSGNDSGEDMFIDISTDNGTSWTTILTQRGGSNRTFNLSASPVVALSSSANTTYASGSQSAFSLQLSGINQFRFRMTASNNRNEENWVIDDVSLTATSTSAGIPFNLPTADAGDNQTICVNGEAQLSVSANSFQAPLVYAWTPSISLNNATIQNPIATPSTNQTYTVTIRDAHGCRATSQVNVTLHGLGGTNGLWTGNDDREWFNCLNWHDGQIPTASTDVLIPVTSNNPMIDLPGALTHDISISPGALLDINDATSSLVLYGSLYNNGNISHTEGRVTLAGTDDILLSGHPIIFHNLHNEKTGTVTLETDVRINTELELNGGNIITDIETLELGNSITETGTLTYHSGHVEGRMKRWFAGINVGSISGLYPLGVGGNDRFVTVEYLSAPISGGSLMAEFIPTDMGSAGFPITITDGSCAPFDLISGENEGYWQIDDADGLTGGNYDITLVGEGLSISDLCQLSAVKRVGVSDWMQSGIHEDPTGDLTRPILKRLAASGWSNWGLGNASVNPLPVKLVSFQGDCVENTSNLRWSTASELNSYRFVVERSSDLQYFEPIAERMAFGNSNEIRNYEMELPRTTDKISYYRLRQEDFDGAYEYFGPVSVDCGSLENWKVYAYQGTLYIHGPDASATNYTLGIKDMAGRNVYEKNVVSASSAVSEAIDVHTLASGMYVICLGSAYGEKAYKIVIP